MSFSRPDFQLEFGMAEQNRMFLNGGMRKKIPGMFIYFFIIFN